MLIHFIIKEFWYICILEKDSWILTHEDINILVKDKYSSFLMVIIIPGGENKAQKGKKRKHKITKGKSKNVNVKVSWKERGYANQMIC